MFIPGRRGTYRWVRRVPPLCGLRAYEMSSATATAVGDNTPPGRNRLPPPRSPLNSTSHRVLSCCWTTVMMTLRWGWRYFADVDEVAAMSVDRTRRRFKGVLGDIVWNGSQENIGNYRQADGVRYTVYPIRYYSDIIMCRIAHSFRPQGSVVAVSRY